MEQFPDSVEELVVCGIQLGGDVSSLMGEQGEKGAGWGGHPERACMWLEQRLALAGALTCCQAPLWDMRDLSIAPVLQKRKLNRHIAQSHRISKSHKAGV